MASKFFGSSSESEKSESESENENVNQKVAGNKFMAAFESDSESEDEGRVVRSEKDRIWDGIFEKIVRIRSAVKINDWSQIHDEFEEVNKQIDKSKMLVIKHGLPGFYVKMLAEVEDFLKSTLKEKELMAKMKPVVLRALNRMKLVVRKHNSKYEAEIARFREHPEEFKDPEAPVSKKKAAVSSDDSEEDSDESSESDSESESSESSSESSDNESGSGSESDSMFSESSSDSSSSSEDEVDLLPGRAKWLKKVVDTTKQKEKDQKKKEKQALQAAKPKQIAADADKEKELAKRLQQVKLETMTEEGFDKKFSELYAARGRKGTDGRQLLRHLEILSRVSKMFGPKKEISTLMYLISTIFDVANTSIDEYLDLQKWRYVHLNMSRVMTLLNSNKELFLELIPATEAAEVVTGNQGKAADLMKKAVEEIEEEEVIVNPNAIRAIGNLEALIIKLEAEYTKSLQQINPHTQEYVIRLSDETDLIELVESVKAYYIRIGELRSASEMALMQVEHMYYKHDTTAKAIKKAHIFNEKFGKYSEIHPASRGSKFVNTADRNVLFVHPASFLGEAKIEAIQYEPMVHLEQLCSFIYKHGDERSRARALLCSVYHNALHDRYYQARDLFLISHIQDTIDKADTKTQILYNRALVTLGLSAFRMGLIQKAHDCLAGICSGRVKELLAQGQPRWQDKDPDQEKAERRRQIPYHMHINQDLLDCCHLICAMFLEMPNLARSHVQTQVISRPFRKYLNMYGMQVFTGPPENTREHVLASAKALMIGDWSKARKFLTSLEVWNLIPNDGGSAVKSMLNSRVREEALRLYLITYSNQYESVSISQLCEMFEMEEKVVRKIVSKMIFGKEISAAWDQVDGVCTLVLYRVDATPLQNLVLQVTEKVAYIVETNERILDPLAGSYGYKDEWTRGGDSRKPYGDRAGAPRGDDGDKSRKGREGWTGGRGGGRGRGGREEGGRGGRGRGRGGRGVGGRGPSDGTSVWGHQNATESLEAQPLGANSFTSSSQRRPGPSRPQYGGATSSYGRLSTSSQNINRPMISSVGGRDSDGIKKVSNSWMSAN